MGASLFVVYTAQSHHRLPCRSPRILFMRVLWISRSFLAIRVLPCQATTPGLHGQVNAPMQTCVRRDSNPRREHPQSLTAFNLNHSAIREYTFGIECSHHLLHFLMHIFLAN